jgi:iron-sulfur cluster repair protein YtfE (RIC family)
MNPNCKQIHAHAYTVPRSLEQQLQYIRNRYSKHIYKSGIPEIIVLSTCVQQLEMEIVKDIDSMTGVSSIWLLL